MAIVDVIYDVVSGVIGTIFGVCMTLLATSGRTRRTNNLLTETQTKLDALADENLRLIGALRERESKILKLEEEILNQNKTSVKKKTTKKRA